MRKFVQEATVAHAFYGREDHGILTMILRLEFSGLSQGFGCLALDEEKTGPSFRDEILRLFGVKTLKELEGKDCKALYASAEWNAPIEGLEVQGRRFTITGWRRKMFGEAESPWEQKIRSLKADIEHHERVLNDRRKELQLLELSGSSGYKNWENEP